MSHASVGMVVSAWSQNLDAERTDAEQVRLAASKEELIAGSDIISIHLVLSDRTRGLVSPELLRSMRPTALLINTSRGAIVDELALAEALEDRSIAGAGIAVFLTEPVPGDHPLRTAPTVLATPHLGYVTEGNYAIYFPEAVEDIQAFLTGTPTRTLT